MTLRFNISENKRARAWFMAAIAATLACGPLGLQAEGPVVKLVTQSAAPNDGPRAPVVTLAPPPAVIPTPKSSAAAAEVATRPAAKPLVAPAAIAVQTPPAMRSQYGTSPIATSFSSTAARAAAVAPVKEEGAVASEAPAANDVAARDTAAPAYISVLAPPKPAPMPARPLGPERAPVFEARREVAETRVAPPVEVPVALPATEAPLAPEPVVSQAPVANPAPVLGPAPAPVVTLAPAPIAAPGLAEARLPLAVAEAQPAPMNPMPPPMAVAAPPAAVPAMQTLDCPGVNPVRCGVQCDGFGCDPSWTASRPIPWQVFAQGEYVGPSRIAHVPEYRLRVDDQVEFIFRITATKVAKPYRLEVGDRVKVQSLSASVAEQEVAIQPDGTVTLSLLGQVPASGRTVEEMRQALDEMYVKFVKQPSMIVLPIKFNTRLEELRATVDARAGAGGQRQTVRVTPEGTVQLSGVGSVFVQGLTLSEVKREVDERYAQLVDGFDVTPVLTNRAPRYVYVLGEVRNPGRYLLEGPTTSMQAIAMAGSWNVGADLKRLVIFRRDDCWQLMATKLDLHGAMFGKKPCPPDEIWLRDSDIVLVPKSAMLATDDLLNLVFTRGLYAVMPVSAQLNFAKLSTL